ncbi:MAG: hypothetical protein ACFFDW_00730, partial [Candidatus Thorarchaeota archaeon]
MVLRELKNLRKNNTVILFKVFLKSNRKRFILTLISAVIIFSLLTTFSIVWYNSREQAFQEYCEDFDWNDDSLFSAYRFVGTATEGGVSLNEITDVINSMKELLNNIAPNL